MSIFTKIYLLFWKSHKFVGPNKEIRLTRTYEIVGKRVLDVIWCLRDYRNIPSSKRLRSSLIEERTSPNSIISVIKRVEREELDNAIQHYLDKMYRKE